MAPSYLKLSGYSSEMVLFSRGPNISSNVEVKIQQQLGTMHHFYSRLLIKLRLLCNHTDIFRTNLCSISLYVTVTVSNSPL